MFTVARMECIICAAVLTNEGTIPPAVCSALAYAPDYWESPEGAKVAEGIGKVLRGGKVPSRPMVKAHIEPEYREWLDHPMFNDPLPWSCLEGEAKDLIRLYRNKRLVSTVGKFYQKMTDKPQAAADLGIALKLELEAMI